MKVTRDAGRAVLLAALAAALCGCGSLAKPGEELWPYGTAALSRPGSPAGTAAIGGPEGTYIGSATVDGRPVPLIGNRSSRELVVVYQTEAGGYETVVVPAGGTVTLAQPARRIIEVR